MDRGVGLDSGATSLHEDENGSERGRGVEVTIGSTTRTIHVCAQAELTPPRDWLELQSQG